MRQYFLTHSNSISVDCDRLPSAPQGFCWFSSLPQPDLRDSSEACSSVRPNLASVLVECDCFSEPFLVHENGGQGVKRQCAPTRIRTQGEGLPKTGFSFAEPAELMQHVSTEHAVLPSRRRAVLESFSCLETGRVVTRAIYRHGCLDILQSALRLPQGSFVSPAPSQKQNENGDCQPEISGCIHFVLPFSRAL